MVGVRVPNKLKNKKWLDAKKRVEFWVDEVVEWEAHSISERKQKQVEETEFVLCITPTLCGQHVPFNVRVICSSNQSFFHFPYVEFLSLNPNTNSPMQQNGWLRVTASRSNN